jgi:hypothetical protein
MISIGRSSCRHRELNFLNHTSYAMICFKLVLPAAAWYFPILFFVFALCERENGERQEEMIT